MDDHGVQQVSETGKSTKSSASKYFRIKEKNEHRRLSIFSKFVKAVDNLASEGWNKSSIH